MDDILPSILKQLSINDKVRYARVCRSWLALLRSKAFWVGIPLRVTLSDNIWDDSAKTLRKDQDAIVDTLQRQVTCGLLHATQLEVGFFCDDWDRRESAAAQLTTIAQCFLDRLGTSLAIESLTLDGIFPTPELCRALTPHCKHTKTLRFTFPLNYFELPSLRPVLEACPSLDEIYLGCYNQGCGHILAPLREIDEFAERRLRAFSCVRALPEHPFLLQDVDPAHVAPLLPWFGSTHFNVRSLLERSIPFTVPLPGIGCHLYLNLLRDQLDDHLQQCRADHHTITSRCRALSVVPSSPSLQKLQLYCDRHPEDITFSPIPLPNLRSFRLNFMLLKDLRTLSVVCPTLSSLSVSIVDPFFASGSDDAFPSFPLLTDLTLTAAYSALVFHLVSTSPHLTKLGLCCPAGGPGTLEAILALPSLISLRLNFGVATDGRHFTDAERMNGLPSELPWKPHLPCSNAASSAQLVPGPVPRLKNLQCNFRLEDLQQDPPVLCVPGLTCILLSNSSTSLESLGLGSYQNQHMEPIVDVLFAGQFPLLRLARTCLEPDTVAKLRARHPLCSWNASTSMNFEPL